PRAGGRLRDQPPSCEGDPAPHARYRSAGAPYLADLSVGLLSASAALPVSRTSPMSAHDPETANYQEGGPETVGRPSSALFVASPPPPTGHAKGIRRNVTTFDQVVRALLHRRLRAACAVIAFVFFFLFVMQISGQSDPVMRI